MEVISSNSNQNDNYNDGNQNGYYQNDRQEDDQSGENLKNDDFSKKKNLFRVEIRNKKTRTLLQAKRNKNYNDQNHFDNTEALPPFNPSIIDQTSFELNQQNPNFAQIQQNLRIIRREIEVNAQEILQMIKNSTLFIQIVYMITRGRKQPSLMLEIAYDIVINVTSYCDCGDVIDEMTDILLKRDENQQEIDDYQNSQLYQASETRKHYVLSVIENHIENDEFMDIREAGVLLLSNMAAEESERTIKTILSKAKLFTILRENVEIQNHTKDMLESIVNLLSNLSRRDKYFEFNDFVDAPELINVLFPLIINTDIVNTTLMSTFKKIVSKADDDEVHQIVNYYYNLIMQMTNFVLTCNLNNKYHGDCCAYILEIFDNFCSCYESLTNQIVGMGIFDPITHLLNQSIPNELVEICLDLLTTIFSKNSHQINDRFIFEEQFNKNQYLTRKIISMCSICQTEIKNSALRCISSLLQSSNQQQIECFFEDKLIKTLLDSLQSDSVQQDTITDILNGLINLIFIGNLNYSIDQNPYSRIFLQMQGDFVLDSIQEKLSDDGYFASDKLLNIILLGNQED